MLFAMVRDSEIDGARVFLAGFAVQTDFRSIHYDVAIASPSIIMYIGHLTLDGVLRPPERHDKFYDIQAAKARSSVNFLRLRRSMMAFVIPGRECSLTWCHVG